MALILDNAKVPLGNIGGLITCVRVDFARCPEPVRRSFPGRTVEAAQPRPKLSTCMRHPRASANSTSLKHCLYFGLQAPLTHRIAHLHNSASTMVSLAGKVISVTGSASGIGLATAKALFARGAGLSGRRLDRNSKGDRVLLHIHLLRKSLPS